MRNFSDDHPIELIRGIRKPNARQTLLSLARRAAYLSTKLNVQCFEQGWYGLNGVGRSAVGRELVALAKAAELIEEAEELRTERDDLPSAIDGDELLMQLLKERSEKGHP
jgi:hypothetical protein